MSFQPRLNPENHEMLYTAKGGAWAGTRHLLCGVFGCSLSSFEETVRRHLDSSDCHRFGKKSFFDAAKCTALWTDHQIAKFDGGGRCPVCKHPKQRTRGGCAPR